MPDIVVLMPVRNALPTIERAVMSTLRAMPHDAELAILDDGSTDGTTELLGRLANQDRRVTLRVGGVGQGVAASLNELIRETDSRVIARMDADDICLPWRFNIQERLLGSSSSLVFSTVAVRDDRRARMTIQMPMPIASRVAPAHLLLGNPFVHSTLFGRRSVIEALSGYRGVPSEDYDLWLRLASSGSQIRRGAVPVLIYRRHDGQVTAQNDWKKAAALNSSTAEAHADLAETLLETRFRVFAQLRSSANFELGSPEDEAQIELFFRALRGPIGRTRLYERYWINRRIQALRKQLKEPK